MKKEGGRIVAQAIYEYSAKKHTETYRDIQNMKEVSYK